MQFKNIDEMVGAEYNPRKADEERLKMLEISISKVGFLLPVYINQHGTIIMDFDVKDKYADFLRHNSFRRAMTNRAGLGKGFYVYHFGAVTTKEFNIEKSKSKWIRKYGRNVLDFGAGKLTDTAILRDIGVNSIPFEPFMIDGNEVSTSKSRKIALDFLKSVEDGVQFDSIFISSVFNSVPFREDREKIIRIVSALSSSKTRLYVWAMSEHHSQNTIEKKDINKKMSSAGRFRLDYEEGIVLGEISKKPKVQKYHTNEELYNIIKVGFNTVSTKNITDSIMAIAKNPIVDIPRLKEALEFEFNLLHPTGERLGLVDEALRAFEKRLNIKF